VAFAWRPAYAFSAAAVVLALILGPARVPLPDAATVAVPAEVLVQFRLDAPQAQVVTLAGDFTGWQQAHPLKRSEPGVWTVVVPLEPGVHDYAFIVDGERWMPDPMAPAVSDGFGGLNSRISVLAPDSRRPL
jgi:1,4-alpha-glucan branching enzyme